MKIQLHFRHHIKPDKEIEDYTKKKIQKLLTFNSNIMEAHIDIEGGKEHKSSTKYRVSVTLHIPSKQILHATGRGFSAKAATDDVYEELKKEIEKHNHKKTLSHKNRKERKIIGSPRTE